MFICSKNFVKEKSRKKRSHKIYDSDGTFFQMSTKMDIDQEESKKDDTKKDATKEVKKPSKHKPEATNVFFTFSGYTSKIAYRSLFRSLSSRNLQESLFWGAQLQTLEGNKPVEAVSGCLLHYIQDHCSLSVPELVFHSFYMHKKICEEKEDTTKEQLLGALIRSVCDAPKSRLIPNAVSLINVLGKYNLFFSSFH